MNQEEYEKLIYGDFIDHNNNACLALFAYEENSKQFDRQTAPGNPVFIPAGSRMSDFASRYGTTVKEMKEHWRCVEKSIPPPYGEGLKHYSDSPRHMAKFSEIYNQAEAIKLAAERLASSSGIMIKHIRKLHLPASSEWKNARFVCRLLKKEFTGL
jgi:hypothetical protein